MIGEPAHRARLDNAVATGAILLGLVPMAHIVKIRAD
jgi:hypothetical protein